MELCLAGTWDGKNWTYSSVGEWKTQYKGEDHHRHSPSWNSHHNPLAKDQDTYW
uniref:Uncharacterized protein n=1 Tax=Anguilla anguilla TaxID=7936 RepID=A0A0E9RQR0_ANGAN